MSASEGVGTLVWARRGGGRLSAADRWRLTAEAVTLQLARMPRQLARRLGLPGREAPFDLSLPAPPDSALARTVLERVEQASPPFLLQHLHRVRAWGHLLAQRNGHRLDDELFYLAALLHDWGLAGGEPAPGSCCFALDGAEGALSLLLGEGMPAHRATAVANAICLHLNVRVSLAHGREAHYLHAAAGLDVIGLRRGKIPEPWLRRVLAEHPRTDWEEGIVPRLLREVKERRGCRMEFLARRLAFLRRVQAVRFPGAREGGAGRESRG